MIVRFEAAAIGIFGAREDPYEGLDVLEARLARIASLGCYPVDLAGGGVGARLDAAMSLLDGGFADEFVGGGGAEIVPDIGFERGLVAFEGKQVIGLVGKSYRRISTWQPIASMLTRAPSSCLVSAS